MVFRAITSAHYEWLKFVWGFQKNFIGPRSKQEYVTFEQLFDMMLRADQEQHIETILDWKVDSNDNILHALLTHNMDKKASEYMGIYSHFLDEDLFLYCIDHGNNIFLQDALLLSAFDKMIFREEQVIGEILNILREGHRTNFIMNVLTLVDISVWKNKHLNDLVQVINGYVDQ